MAGFHEWGRLPYAFGALNGTQLTIKSPYRDVPDEQKPGYLNHKGTQSMSSAGGVVHHDGGFVAVQAGMSLHAAQKWFHFFQT
jgi:hypothetical protein